MTGSAIGAPPATRPFRMIKGQSTLSDLADGAGLAMGIGNVYNVCKTTDTANYAWAVAKQRYYADGSLMLHSTIASALAATVECRNDYVVVMPSDSDYDITVALVMDKKAVHLICPAGLGYDRGATNACRIHQETSALAVIAVSDAAVEIAGFYFKPYTGISTITLAATSYAPNIHHNSFMMQTTSSNEPIIAGTGDACGWGGIERNWFISQGGDDQTVPILIDIKASATGARVNYNDFMMGDGNTATIAISNAATKGSCNYNTFAKAGADGDYGHCIAIGSYGTAIGNRLAGEDSIIVTGGAAGESLCDNMFTNTLDDSS